MRRRRPSGDGSKPPLSEAARKALEALREAAREAGKEERRPNEGEQQQ